MKQTQLKIVISKLEKNQQISRNWCLKRFISRLGARINDLKQLGWLFETETRPTVKPDGSKGKDFVYKLKK